MNIHQSCARKLVEGAVDYAKNLGFVSHQDYQTAKKIFGEVDSEVCPESYEYGKDGKPLFISGLYDSGEKSNWILRTLRKKCGEDGYHYVFVSNPFD